MIGQPTTMNQSCYGINGAEGYPDVFTYFNLRAAVETLQQNVHGAVFDTITTSTFSTVKAIKPPAPLAQHFDQVTKPLLDRILANAHQSRTLATLRDTLLPKLLSGELDAADAAAEVPA